jgi:RNA polymerase sigma-70 factor, ECF subfamily
MQECSDEALLAKFRENQHADNGQKWLNQLFERYQVRVAAWCYRFTGDRDRASDLAQDVFLKVYRSIDSFRSDSKFSTWVYSIARNVCINEMKGRMTRVEGSAEVLDFDIASEQDPNILSVLVQQESVEYARSLLGKTLDETERKVMVLHFAHGITLDAVSRLLGLTNTSGARAYIVSARRKLSAATKRSNVRTKGIG